MNHPFIDFSGRTVLLSGATSGIGSVIASLLASQNARLVLLGRNQQKLDAINKRLHGNHHLSILVDLDDARAIATTLKPQLSALGPLYGLCHCAGVAETRPLAASNPEVLYRQTEINLMAALELSRLVSNRTLGKKGEGSMVLISSIYASIGAPGQVAYCASKGAINAAARAMAIELAPRNIRVNSVSPGFIRTEMITTNSPLSDDQIQEIINKHPMGEGDAMDVARAVSFLLAPENHWITGIDLKVDGGYTAQ